MNSRTISDLIRGIVPPQLEDACLRQSGIADPRWPNDIPEPLQENAGAVAAYDSIRGRTDPQKFLILLRADVTVEGRGNLEKLLRDLTDFMTREMAKPPERSGAVPLLIRESIPSSWRLSITLGFGATLFLTRHGDDRFRLRHAMPRWLRIMPSFTGDAQAFEPSNEAADLIFQICSDHPYVNSAVARRLMRGRFKGRILVRSVEQGFSRADTREWLGFDDGVSNLRSWPDDSLTRLGFVHDQDAEPAWCVNGSYLVYRKIREALPAWNLLDVTEQERRIGRMKAGNRPLSRETDSLDPTIPVYPDPCDSRDGPLDSHIRKTQPRRMNPDFTGTLDLDRRFLRRPYPFLDGVDSNGEIVVGLHFLAFMRNLREQFEWVTQQWQMNPDFPKLGTGIDVLFDKGILSTVGGGYYFCPPEAGADGFIGDKMMRWGH